MWFLFAQRDPKNPLYELKPACKPVEFPKMVSVGDRFTAPVAGRGQETKCIIIEIGRDPATLADINKQLTAKGDHTVDAILIWAEDAKRGTV